MLLGNRESFGIEIRPLTPTWERRYLPEQTAWAALLIWVGGENLCRHSVTGTERVEDALNVPLAALANWLVESWASLLFEERASVFPTSDLLHEDLARWGAAAAPAELNEEVWFDAREEWWSRHFLVAGAEGAILPRLALARQDEKLVLDWQTSRPSGRNGFFLTPPGRARLKWDEGEDVLASFVRMIAEWLRREGLLDLYPWVRQDDPLRELQGSFIDVLELYTGRSRGELFQLTGAGSVEELAGLLGLASTDDPGSSPQTQALRDLPPRLPADARHLLQRREAITREPAQRSLERLRQLSFDAQRSTEIPEEAGYLAATAIRADIGLDGKPAPDTTSLLKLLDVEAQDSVVSLTGTRMVAGLREQRRAAVILSSSPRTSVPWGRRFEHARALGHLLLDPIRGDALGAASSAFSQGSRRRRSGAFAAEFLLPRAALLEATDGVLDRAAEKQVFEKLLARYIVGARTAANHLWNHQLLSSTELRDELIDEYASPQR